jgi:peptidoglycan hydrolase CwlO-like protein
VSSSRRGSARLLLAFALVAGTVAGTVAVSPQHARADSAAAAQKRADKILKHVQAIQKQVDAALAHYDGALTGLATAVNSNVASDIALGDATTADELAQQQAVARIRALYRAGGEAGIYATVLSGGDPVDIFSRVQIVKRVVATDQVVLHTNQRTLRAASVNALNARKAANSRAQAAADVDAVAQRLEGLLSQEQSLLTQAKADAARLRAAEAALAAARSSYGAITEQRIRTIQPSAMSPEYNTLYHQAAATCPGLSWTVLAAIGQVETGHGSNPSTSSAGAMGPMQFLPSTFAGYAVDGDHDGQTDIMNPADAIFTAANYLCANGAGSPDHLANAIWHYNHAGWYVELVLTLSQRYAG